MNRQAHRRNSLLQSGLSRLHLFFRWWLDELKGVLPGPLRRLIASRQQQITIDVRDKRALVRASGNALGHESFEIDIAPTTPQRDIRTQAFLERICREDVLTEVRLPENQILTVDLQLPRATEENLQNVLAFEMDRYTPFNAQHVYYDYRINSRDPIKNTIDVTLFAVPRRRLDTLLSELGVLDLHPDVITVYNEAYETVADGADSGINLLPPDLRPKQTTIRTHINRALLAILLVLIISNLALPIIQQQRTIAALEKEVDRAAQSAAATAAVRAQRDKLSKQLQTLINEKQGHPMILQVLDELSNLLPDSTWLRRFELINNTMSIQGESEAASRLIALLEGSTMFKSVSFRSPVTENPRTHRERFKISATVNPSETQE